MKKKRYLKFGIIMGLALIAVSSFAVFSEPGGTDDPVVTKTYIVDKVVPELKAYVDQQLGIASSGGTVTARPSTFVVVNMNAGQSIIGEAGIYSENGRRNNYCDPKGRTCRHNSGL